MSKIISSASDVGALLAMPIDKIMETDAVIMEGDKTVLDAVNQMQEKNAKVVLISHQGEAIGIVSKSDILFKVAAKNLPLNKVKLREIMSSPVYSLPPHSTLQDALNYMDKYNIKQIIVSTGSSILGIMKRASIYENVQKASMSTVESLTEGAPMCIINPNAVKYVKDLSSAKAVCPYCESPFDDKNTLSKHIDRLHGGAGLLEGDTRQY
ncbi:MAG TPA: CBS domain-containing protein [Nitrosopumilaceae archaeon]|nr:CBS domain-containing protein [Nitrosopumilaceae archaeon]HXV38979.1 CBS domain-containing protein [Nitrosopumilaceae archaeon]